MTLIIIIFASLVALAGLVLLVNPEILSRYLQKIKDSPVIHFLAVVVRLLLGYLLIHQSALSRFPRVIEVLGWIAIVAAIVLLFIGRRNFKRLMSWALTIAQRLGRVAGVFATAFGVFIIYAFV
jgi:uncharacterized protein YjeT (DUF2065 family)